MAAIQPKTWKTRTGENFVIRTAQPEDAAALLGYVRAIAAETEFFVLQPDEFPATEEKEREFLQEHLDNPGNLFLVAETSGMIIGNISFENGAQRRIAHRGTFGLAVVKQWRGRGVGTSLLNALLEWAEMNPLIEKVMLDVFATNDRAMRLYKRLGFVEDGRRPRDVRLGPGEYIDTVAMYRFVM